MQLGVNRSIIILCILSCASVAVPEDIPLTGFAPKSSARELDFEKQLTATLKPGNAEKYLQWITSRPHPAGSEGARITAEYIKQQLIADGLNASIETYPAFLTAPVSTSIELVAPVSESIPTTEDRIEGDEFTEHVAEHPGWDGYSPSGEATGEVVYAGHGSDEDFRQLQLRGIDVKGKIVLMSYFGTGEGTKYQNAERNGAAGVVLYSDPQEDGYRYGDVYPKGDWRPPGGIMRRDIFDLPYTGDPLSPGFPSTDTAKRLKPEQILLPKIPVLPISYRSAQRILSLMDGPIAPYSMQGALPLPYKLGPGPAVVHLKTEMDNRDRSVLNVVAKIPGEKYPDEWIIVGNHHDAWIYGAGDPSSGTASLLEFARGLGELMRQGYRPQRTLIIAFWDAEELIFGSTEWVEDHQEELLQKTVACINMDSSVFNTDRPLSVNAHPLLHQLFRDASRNIRDPKTGKTMFERWRDLQNEFRNTPSTDGFSPFFDHARKLTEPWINEAPDDDAGPFFNILALPASDMYYGSDYGMYHSIYENFHWMKTVVDPTFEYHISMALLQGFVSLQLANADLIPFDFVNEEDYWQMGYERLEKQNKKIPVMSQLLNEWKLEAKKLEAETNAKLLTGLPPHKIEQINKKIYLAARDFYIAKGLPDNKYEHNLWHSSDGLLPGIEKQPDIFLQVLQKRIRSLREIRASLHF